MSVDLDSLRAVFDLHNSAGMDFPDALREHLRPDAEWVESRCFRVPRLTVAAGPSWLCFVSASRPVRCSWRS